MASKRGELTTSATEISRSHDEVHSSKCGFDAALAIQKLILIASLSTHQEATLPEDREYWVSNLRTWVALSSSNSLVRLLRSSSYG